ncbi:MAG: Transporter, major facilitator family [Candidatus Falkowbacteria bacterium GW2011_GWA2_39_24]|uniref:Transporter, major facilitator family n=1 Tax=Candidatus Falkowbacteria bacterium GW2011_GWA2_39_24 TaxID=1618634 RepID=A0A0G0RKK7_9BACT|nr:MAG: Transporter, major facilitator family [Candidatus Falkowbacteria bacterium GW2011_GWA2_39_24]
MRQVHKFYWASFLKNQTYFTPIIILFLQFNHLDLQQVFWIFTIGSIFNFVSEIPTGIIADLYGKRKSIALSKFLIFTSFVFFGFATSFWFFVLAQIIYELGQSFRSGTETAYAYDYLQQNPKEPSYTEVKGKQKFYARIGESLAAAIGGLIASHFGYNMVFFVAAIPAFINWLMNLTWVTIKESTDKFNLRNSYQHIRHAFRKFKNSTLIIITINITIFTAVLAALNKFVQPYMANVGIPIATIGLVYALALGFTALITRYSYKLEQKFGDIKTMNWLSVLAIIPALIIGLGYSSIIGVILFFLVVIAENIRSPIENSIFHDNISSKERATMGSILELIKSLGKIAILPLAGYLTETFSMATAILIMALLLLINSLFFFIRKNSSALERA